MQEIRHDGSKGPIKPFTVEDMRSSLDKPEVKEVRVFKVGRNELCPCGSGKKYKNCCLGSGEKQ